VQLRPPAQPYGVGLVHGGNPIEHLDFLEPVAPYWDPIAVEMYEARLIKPKSFSVVDEWQSPKLGRYLRLLKAQG
jgi:hypothetical protein